MSIVLGFWKLMKWLRANRSSAIAAANLLGVIALAGTIWWQRITINELRAWQDAVIEVVSSAADIRDGKGHLRLVKSGEVLAHINNLGRFKTDTITAQAQARVDDAAHALATERQDAAINRKAADDYEARLAAARADADALRRRLATLSRAAVPASVGLRPESASGNGEGSGGTAPVSGLSDAGCPADATAETDGLSASRGALCAMSIDERQLATEQAIQLDALITTIENFSKAKR